MWVCIAMHLITNKPKLMGKLAGELPAGAVMLGIVWGYKERSWEVLILRADYSYAICSFGSAVSVGSKVARALLDGTPCATRKRWRAKVRGAAKE